MPLFRISGNAIELLYAFIILKTTVFAVEVINV